MRGLNSITILLDREDIIDLKQKLTQLMKGKGTMVFGADNNVVVFSYFEE